MRAFAERLMLYAAMVFWLLILVFAAYGTYQLWAGLIKPNILNFLLLPGTLIAQTGRMPPCSTSAPSGE